MSSPHFSRRSAATLVLAAAGTLAVAVVAWSDLNNLHFRAVLSTADDTASMFPALICAFAAGVAGVIAGAVAMAAGSRAGKVDDDYQRLGLTSDPVDKTEKKQEDGCSVPALVEQIVRQAPALRRPVQALKRHRGLYADGAAIRPRRRAPVMPRRFEALMARARLA